MENRFGKFTKEVEEVLAFANSDKLLSGGKLHEGIDGIVIRDVKEIPTDEDYEKHNDDRMLWRDILDNEAAVFCGIESETARGEYSYDRAFLSNLVLQLTDTYREAFPKRYKKRYLDQDIPGVLVNIVHCRIVMGKDNKFYETLFKVFQSGGYPCGWQGNYPQGKLIAYYPRKKRIKWPSVRNIKGT
jgi:hypothetical protein